MPGIWHNKMEELFPQEMSEVKFLNQYIIYGL